MASSFEKSVKGGTKIKLAAPKSKYVEHILVATHAGEQGVAEVFRVLQIRLRDSTWTIVFKSLIIVHFMIREGEPNVTLRYLASGPERKLAVSSFTEVQVQGKNIISYAEYLVSRATAYGATKVDYVRAGEGRLKKLSVDKGLLRETESVQDQIRALLKCDFLTVDTENDITMTAFRLLTMDLLVLFHCMNEGMVNILEHFFEMAKTDAERTLRVYRTFVRQTDLAVKYFSVARNYEHVTRLEIPKIRHAPTSLAGQLEEYVKDNDFDVMRRQYIAQQQAKKGGKPTNGSSSKAFDEKSAPKKSEPFPEPKGASAASNQQKGPAPDLIDFFASIEQNQTHMNTNPFQQPQFTQQQAPMQTGFQQQQAFPPQNTGMPAQQQTFSPVNGQGTNPFQQMQQPPQIQQPQLNQQQQMQMQQQQLQQQQMLQQAQQPQQPQQLQPNFTGAGFGGYTPQPQAQPQQQNRFTPGLSSIPQNTVAPFQQQAQQPFATGSTDTSNSTNPFRQSMLPSATGASAGSFGSSATPLSQQSTNPFAKLSPSSNNSPFSAPNSQFSNLSLNSQQQPQPLMPAATGTNPFARLTLSPASSLSPFSAQATGVSTNVTGSTNPFRQSQFVNQQTGQGWQSGPQGTIGGMHPEQLQTTPVFPRPGQAQPQQPQNTGWQG
ncbi:ANTH-domain-containing protein [Venturia nashicola]|uniref:ANTH-domain-containing protein n=1 Tax=Venturia nashicola TaxID=86259 RepID=A0A4Z1PK57_9PEZI|nr:ANTH-domain-containing protein [Venturia nashicola]